MSRGQDNLTVEHTLTHCAEYFHFRYKCFDIDNFGELCQFLPIYYTRGAGLFYLI